nr:putative membrane protein [Quercus suber]
MMNVKQSTYHEQKALLKALVVDVTSAVVAGIGVAPIVTVIDLAVTEVAFGHKPFLDSVRAAMPKLICRPHRILLTRPFCYMFLLYAGTYTAANLIDTVSTDVEGRRSGAMTSSLTKLSTVSAVNVGLSLAKDNQFAKMFGTTSTRPLPLVSYAPLILRDALTIAASFNLPPVLAENLPESWDNVVSRLTITQLAAPAASQLIATPLHLLGMDLYNRPASQSLKQRIVHIRRACMSTTLARMLRVLPGLGLGNIINTNTRTTLARREPLLIRDVGRVRYGKVKSHSSVGSGYDGRIRNPADALPPSYLYGIHTPALHHVHEVQRVPPAPVVLPGEGTSREVVSTDCRGVHHKDPDVSGTLGKLQGSLLRDVQPMDRLSEASSGR